MESQIIIRADGGPQTGMGHVMRSLALADMLKDSFTIAVAIQETAKSVLTTIHNSIHKIILLPQTDNYSEDASNFSLYVSSANIVVLDGYNFKTEYQKKIKERNCKLVCIDDLHQWHHLADAIINYAENVSRNDYSAELYTQFYLGTKYVLLRKEFLKRKLSVRKMDAVRKVFVSMGASDINNITRKVAEAAIQIDGIAEIHLMLGSINPHLKSFDDLIKKNKRVKIVTHIDISAEDLFKLLEYCDAAICPASTISLECCTVGIGLISGYTSKNQEGILNGLKKNKCIADWGNLNQLSVNDIKNKFEALIKEPQLFDEMVINQSRMIDGNSPENVRNIFKKLASEKLSYRMAELSDVDQYFRWANDPLVRSNSYDQKVIKYEDHIKWFEAKLSSKDCFMYVFMDGENNLVGQVRIDNSGKEIIIGISVDENFRGRSHGVEMLKKASNDYLKKNHFAKIIAYIKIENSSSRKVFMEAGFNSEEILDMHGHKSFRLSKKLAFNE